MDQRDMMLLAGGAALGAAIVWALSGCEPNISRNSRPRIETRVVTRRVYRNRPDPRKQVIDAIFNEMRRTGAYRYTPYHEKQRLNGISYEQARQVLWYFQGIPSGHWA